jgi:osmotically-inducible protein OsmY
VTPLQGAARFSGVFDRAVAACAHAQVLMGQCAATAVRARATHASSRRLRTLAAETRDAWMGAGKLFDVMRHEVESVAGAMRAEGVERDAAAAAVRAHVRFVLYDGGLGEHEAEPVVERASQWVEQLYNAA